MARSGFTIHWNGPPAECVGKAHDRCVSFWSAVRRYHIESKGWTDIAYSFGVCPHGTRFTGRGWDLAQWANGTDQVGPDDGNDADWYTVLTFLGEGETPTGLMVDGVRVLISEGRSSGRCGLRVLPHNAFKQKTCPGPEFTAHAQAWDNQPTTPPPPAPPATEDLMLTFEATGKPVFLLSGGKCAGFKTATDLRTVRDAYQAANGKPIPHVVLGAGTYNEWVTRFRDS